MILLFMHLQQLVPPDDDRVSLTLQWTFQLQTSPNLTSNTHLTQTSSSLQMEEPACLQNVSALHNVHAVETLIQLIVAADGEIHNHRRTFL